LKTLILLFLFMSSLCHAQKIDLFWNESFRKELHLTCSASDLLCEKVCSSSSACYLQEGPCRSCVGTSLQMHHIFSEIGRSIGRREAIRPDDLAAFFLKGNFVSFSAQDVFNIIDAHNSISLFKKFESLCPEESLNQILFFNADPITRRPTKAEFIYCEYEDHETYFKVEDKILLEYGPRLSFRHKGVF
jgi:hypothetical protein